MSGPRIEPSTDVQFTPPGEELACFEIAVVNGPGVLRLDETKPGRALVGQAPTSDLVLADRLVSRRHLALEVKGNELRVEDLGSTNGSFVGGVRIVEVLLRGGEHLTLGETTLAVRRLSRAPEAGVPAARAFGRLIGASLQMRRLHPLLERLASSSAPLLIEGETGTGKELVAETLHERGPRPSAPFVVFDCAGAASALGPEALIGDARSGANKRGIFEMADGGTLVLDEVGELPLELQPLLLRAIERGEVQRLGEEAPRKVNVRVIATSRLDLDRAVQDGTFRDDLFYRLAMTRLELPPLRERAGDIGILARHFWSALGGAPSEIPYEAFESLERAPYPGNVRELHGAVTRLLTMGVPAATVDEAVAESATLAAFCRTDQPYAMAKDALLRAFERAYVAAMVDEHGTVQAAAAASGLALRYFQLLRAKHRAP